jgi:hypothetical protein
LRLSCNDKADRNWLLGIDREKLFRQAFWTFVTEVGTRLHNYAEVRAYLEKEHPDWIRALTPRHINAPPDYLLQRVLAVQVYPRAAALLRQLLQ